MTDTEKEGTVRFVLKIIGIIVAQLFLLILVVYGITYSIGYFDRKREEEYLQRLRQFGQQLEMSQTAISVDEVEIQKMEIHKIVDIANSPEKPRLLVKNNDPDWSLQILEFDAVGRLPDGTIADRKESNFVMCRPSVPPGEVGFCWWSARLEPGLHYQFEITKAEAPLPDPPQ